MPKYEIDQYRVQLADECQVAYAAFKSQSWQDEKQEHCWLFLLISLLVDEEIK